MQEEYRSADEIVDAAAEAEGEDAKADSKRNSTTDLIRKYNESVIKNLENSENIEELTFSRTHNAKTKPSESDYRIFDTQKSTDLPYSYIRQSSNPHAPLERIQETSDTYIDRRSDAEKSINESQQDCYVNQRPDTDRDMNNVKVEPNIVLIELEKS